MARRIAIPPAATFGSLVAVGLSKATASRAMKRGWYAPHYHEKYQPGISPDFSAISAYEIAEAVFYRHFWPSYTWLKEDLVQEAVLRQLELSGDPSCHPGIMYGAARNAMRGFIAKWRHPFVSIDVLDYSHEIRLSSDS